LGEDPPASATPQDREQVLKSAARRLAQDKQELKDQLDKEKSAYSDDLAQWNQERLSLKSEFGALAETIANRPQVASPEQVEQIQSLEREIAQLESDPRRESRVSQELQLNREVLQKQVQQYKKSIDELEEELAASDGLTRDCAMQKRRISELEDELRQNSRRARELNTALEWSNHEHQKLTHELLLSGRQFPRLTVCAGDSTSMLSSPTPLPGAARVCYSAYHEREGSGQEIEAFFAGLPDCVERIEADNLALMQAATKYKRKHARLKSARPPAPPTIAPEKLKAAIQKLAQARERKKQKIAGLKDIVRRQHESLQKLLRSPTNRPALFVSLRNLVAQLAVCDQSQRAALSPRAMSALEALQNEPES
jgi:predicted RNase H-like nuclease (RuvC/YqgF family)